MRLRHGSWWPWVIALILLFPALGFLTWQVETFLTPAYQTTDWVGQWHSNQYGDGGTIYVRIIPGPPAHIDFSASHHKDFTIFHSIPLECDPHGHFSGTTTVEEMTVTYDGWLTSSSLRMDWSGHLDNGTLVAGP
jgi:hypothetical protein